MPTEVLLLFGLILLNGVFAMSEIALVTARRARLQALVEQGEKVLRHRGIEYVEVKTLGPSRRDTNYGRTRDFYAAIGFRPVEENNLWGDANPCLILIKHLACQPPAS
jgi:hypothetical protein